ncbi:MAG: 5-methyltetrahydrofolate:corrinoid/iron-sulfur protein co-methyltransferase [candidate division WS2 bacterium]|uniref:5-methyltetrahydrofolate:corrinoid/iron-sulfur protein co-methyltransferase n=1 Tax=Psychracetigena formicireducens TaxID=2986056 RepID=A0A9E2BG68_PSYF1|nr:5-methyltetrahydrofolate:corrinoid/iron-sulfur protein co-methyltransferase [Candidatus Psychracetigena formicireducens]MBT9145008.1 5-methyltetrahydrofolate:corrinoid/iron-sulfur protein co-methyltransferase [Candidatus Psychracetigena formicireducens]MBT9150250.1 5-methyltetrahydrofolate:corrinoid/iron-sulfur protein co-methyltransferase [Candidatus Psychracetigena formicireducens]
MILIGENIHILSKVVSLSIKEKKAKPLQELVIRQAEAGVDYIDLNVGPARKDPESMRWLVEITQEVTDLPLSLDTTNPKTMEAGLTVCKVKPLINSASGKEESKQEMLPLAAKYNCDIIVSVLTDKGIPSDTNARAEAIMETITYANDIGIPNESIWVDPIMFPLCVDQVQISEFLEFIKLMPDIAPGAKSTLGLSNLSNGVPHHLRPILNQVYLVMLQRYNLYSSIVDSFDNALINLVKGKLPETVNLIYRAMDGDVDLSTLSQEERDIVKTVNVLTGKTLFSNSWLEI